MALMFIPSSNVVPIARERALEILRVPQVSSVTPYVLAPQSGNPGIIESLTPNPIITPVVDAVAVQSEMPALVDPAPSTGIWDFVKANPLPVALGVGVIVFAVTRKKRRK